MAMAKKIVAATATAARPPAGPANWSRAVRRRHLISSDLICCSAPLNRNQCDMRCDATCDASRVLCRTERNGTVSEVRSAAGQYRNERYDCSYVQSRTNPRPVLIVHIFTRTRGRVLYSTEFALLWIGVLELCDVMKRSGRAVDIFMGRRSYDFPVRLADTIGSHRVASRRIESHRVAVTV